MNADNLVKSSTILLAITGCDCDCDCDCGVDNDDSLGDGVVLFPFSPNATIEGNAATDFDTFVLSVAIFDVDVFDKGVIDDVFVVVVDDVIVDDVVGAINVGADVNGETRLLLIPDGPRRRVLIPLILGILFVFYVLELVLYGHGYCIT